MTDLAAALIKDVPRYEPDNPPDSAPSMKAEPQGDWLRETEVLAALSRALDPAIAEQAGEVLEGVTPGPWVYEYTGIGHTVRQPGSYNAIFTVNHAGNFEQDARFIAWCRESVPALLAQNAALRAERDRYLRHLTAGAESLNAYKARAEAAEAKVEKLRGKIRDWEARIDACEWSTNSSLTEDIRAEMRAALTTEERK